MSKHKKRKFKFAKLVRDRIAENVIKNGGTAKSRVLENDEFIKELKVKIQEEANEIPTNTDEELISEIADLQEIIDNLCEALNISKNDLVAVQEKKNEKAGSFKKRIYIDYVEVDEEDQWLDYYLQNPEKYPEIK